MDIMKKIEEIKIVPVAVIEDAENAKPLGEALLNGGLPLVEVTFRTAAAAESISILRKEFPDMIVGAGTVLTVDHVKDAVKAGTQFIVTPGFNPTIVDYCVGNNISICPGLNIPSFIEWGMERGLYHFKFYPADLSGGPKMLQLLSGPYPNVKFMPTGGVNNETLAEYLKLDNVFACGGSWLVKRDLISSKNFKEITNRTKKAISLI
ncbi:MAG: bifunctional 4-hydroxy-2-oxoglutarate aldolase/2-dehydro-3-deoxy-phosphogluconate aldolase [Candidatus Lokiarchaeota archaeon]|nr:bifunctional 4-hydroxy-2-oxoglutarate aldolase/2-dehydro-3-deoxy-phosphogluconate aldolase [Candidatus Lokiarchaeota archaeon]MBD3340970.1 bifunctional 4-hydroxy-2-oxoglutarate aldolase/2-dehydro-3-deoxy-phosphogluconate aldolase [Candidatus Lokiarchaeota archaeon]